MSTQHNKLVENLLTGRSALLELILAGVILAIAVEYLASASISLMGSNALQILIVGGLLLAISLLLFLRRTISTTRTRKIRLEGFLVYLNKENIIIDIPRYRYATAIHSYLKAVFAENTALKTLWEKEKISDSFRYDKDKGLIYNRSTHANLLIKEATEYFVLDRLSTHLTDYFNKEEFDKNQLRKYTREDVADIFLKNRFLEQFSRPMDQRPHFVDDSMQSPKFGKVVKAYGKDGVIYEDFDLVLPASSNVSRTADGSILINTKRFSFKVKSDFEAVMTVLPRGFEEFYLGQKDHQDIACYKASLNIDVNFRSRSYFSAAGWNYHKWVDSFIESLESDMSEESFLRDLNWPVVLTMIEIFKKNKPNQEDASDQ